MGGVGLFVAQICNQTNQKQHWQVTAQIVKIGNCSIILTFQHLKKVYWHCYCFSQKTFDKSKQKWTLNITRGYSNYTSTGSVCCINRRMKNDTNKFARPTKKGLHFLALHLVSYMDRWMLFFVRIVTVTTCECNRGITDKKCFRSDSRLRFSQNILSWKNESHFCTETNRLMKGPAKRLFFGE